MKVDFKNVRFFISILFLIALVACNNKSSQKSLTPSSADSSETNIPPPPPASAIDLPAGRIDSVPVKSPTSATAGDPELLIADTIPTEHQEVKFNPPHGQPGHRCDVAVGAVMGPPTGANFCK